MDQVSTAQDQNVLIAQRSKSSPKLIMKRSWLRCVDTELNDGYFGIWKQMTQHRPCSVIESPTVIKSDRNGCEQLSCTTGKLRAAWSVIFHLIERLREAAKVVNRARLAHCSYECAGDKPVS